MNRYGFIKEMRQKLKKYGITRADIDKMLTALGEVIIETLQKGDDIALRGLFSAEVKTRKERQGFNPSTCQKELFPAVREVRLTASETIKNAIRGEEGE